MTNHAILENIYTIKIVSAEKRLMEDKLAEEYTENIDENDMISDNFK